MQPGKNMDKKGGGWGQAGSNKKPARVLAQLPHTKMESATLQAPVQLKGKGHNFIIG